MRNSENIDYTIKHHDMRTKGKLQGNRDHNNLIEAQTAEINSWADDFIDSVTDNFKSIKGSVASNTRKRTDEDTQRSVVFMRPKKENISHTIQNLDFETRGAVQGKIDHDNFVNSKFPKPKKGWVHEVIDSVAGTFKSAKGSITCNSCHNTKAEYLKGTGPSIESIGHAIESLDMRTKGRVQGSMGHNNLNNTRNY